MVYCKQSSKCAKIEPKINGNMSFILPVTENKLNVAATLHRILNNTNLGFMKDTGRLYFRTWNWAFSTVWLSTTAWNSPTMQCGWSWFEMCMFLVITSCQSEAWTGSWGDGINKGKKGNMRRNCGYFYVFQLKCATHLLSKQ